MSDATKRETTLEDAREEAEETATLGHGGHVSSLEVEREEAQGIEVFADPDATLPASALKEGSPGHEILTGDNVGLGREDESDRSEEREQG